MRQAGLQVAECNPDYIPLEKTFTVGGLSPEDPPESRMSWGRVQFAAGEFCVAYRASSIAIETWLLLRIRLSEVFMRRATGIAFPTGIPLGN